VDRETLEKYRKRLHSRLPLFGARLRRRAIEELALDGSAEAPPGCRVLTALLCGQEELITKGGMELVEPLVEACEDKDAEISGRAREAGSRLRDEAQRAVFFFLAGQWGKYEALDFEHRLLRSIYESADEALRQRIMNQARESGRLEWVEAATVGRQARRLGEMTESEWETTLTLLKDHGRWEEMWQLAQRAPARGSARLLQGLGESGWQPSEAERADFTELVELARRWQEPDTNISDATVPLKTLKGHSGSVTCLAISPDGRLLASGSWDNTVRLWSLPDGRLLKTLKGHRGSVWCLAISPDGRILASGSNDKTVRLWSLPDGRLLKTLKGHRDWVFSLAITPDGQVLASGSKDKTVRLWSLPDGRLLKTLKGHRGSVWCLAISPDGRLLASGNGDHTVRLWSLPDGSPLKTLEGHNSPVSCLAISPDGRLLASGSYDNTVRLWSLPEGSPLKTLGGHSNWVYCLAISPDGRLLASGSNDETVRLWSLPDGRLLKTLKGHRDSVWCLAISPDGRLLASGSWDNTVRLWSSPVMRLAYLPAEQASPEDLAWAQSALREGQLSERERASIEFIAALLRWNARFYIEIEEAPQRIAVGEFDIEIEG